MKTYIIHDVRGGFYSLCAQSVEPIFTKGLFYGGDLSGWVFKVDGAIVGFCPSSCIITTGKN